MPFQLSPGVAVVEKDFSAIVPAVSSSNGAFAGAFAWGPVLAPTSVTSETELVRIFGKPTDANAQAFFTAANFLSYTNSLLVSRADVTAARNAVATQSGGVSGIAIGVSGSGYTSVPTVTFSAPQDGSGTQATAVATLSGGGVTGATVSTGGSGYSGTVPVTFSAPQTSGGVTAVGTATLTGGAVTAIVVGTPGSGYTSAPTATIGGNGTGATVGTVTIQASSVTGITITSPGSGYSTVPTVTISPPASGVNATATATLSVGGVKINNSQDYLTTYINGAGAFGEFAARYPGTAGNSILVSMADSASFANWAYKANFSSAPGTSSYASQYGGSNDELHVIVIDEDGVITGTSGTVLEKYEYVSKANDARKSDGTNNYYKDAINARSDYIYWMDHPTVGSNWGSLATASFNTMNTVLTRSLTGGVDGLTATAGQLQTAYTLFNDDTQYDISLIMMGKADAATTTYVMNLIDPSANGRGDCVVFASPQNISTGDPIIGTGSTATSALEAYRNALPSTSYGVLDSGYKYQYDRYNDKYRWVPLNGDIAGLCARTDYTNDPWFSPGGLNRGQVKNVVKLAHNPTKVDRDVLYKAGINPVVTFPGEGTVLFGDKTLLSKPSAFDRINVRRLFIVMEKAISTAAKYQLFEFNDPFTRAQFKNLVEPFLRDVQGRRGITDFVVKCDDSNNTGQVIDANQFVADIFVKPNRSINFITLNFVAARSSVSFTELGA